MTDAPLRIAGAQDAAAMDAFLAGYSATSMLLRGNLANHCTDDRMAPHGTKFYLTEQDGQITAVFGITNGGYLMAQAPDAPDVGWAAFGQRIKGHSIHFSNNDSASRTYEAIGYQHIGKYRVAHLKTPTKIEGRT